MKFIPGFAPMGESDRSFFFLLSSGETRIAVDGEGSPFLEYLPERLSVDAGGEEFFIGTLGDRECRVLSLPPDTELPAPLVWEDFKSVYRGWDGEEQQPLSRGRQILEWSRTHRFCGSCGCRTERSEREFSCHCPECGENWYPVIAPAVIVRITRGDEILLAHNAHFPEGLYSHIAGFADPGETLEDCVRREVREEVGLEIENLAYFGSQSWPMPHSLMIGFTAECRDPDAEPEADGVEIVHARWFTRENMPPIPSTGSIAGRMLLDYQQNQQS